MIDLGTLGGTESFAYAINGGGQVVGYSTTDSGETHAFLWQPDRRQGWRKGEMIDLGTLGGIYSVANGINGLGKVVGQSTITSSSWHAFLWQPTGKHGDLIDLGTLDGFVMSYANAINGSGQIVGGSEASSGETHAVLWIKDRSH